MNTAVDGRGRNWDRWLLVLATVVLLIRLAFWLWPATNDPREGDAKTEVLPEEPLAESRPAWEDPVPVAVEMEPERLPETLPLPMQEPELPLPSLPLPGEFHFRQTRWGMTMEEVRAAESSVPIREYERGLVYSATTLELPSLVSYVFVQGRLVRARLSFSDPSGKEIPPLSVAQAQRRFLFLREELRSRYGLPEEITTTMKRDVSGFHRQIQKQDEMAKQYNVEIAEAEQRLRKERTVLEKRFASWRDGAERVQRGLAPMERDLRDLRTWKQEALDQLRLSQKSLEEQWAADEAHPLVAIRVARWKNVRGLHDIELQLDFRGRSPRLDIFYRGLRTPVQEPPDTEL